MDISTREKGKVLIFDVQGDLDAKSASILKEKINEKITDGKSLILINLSAVPYMDSAGLGVLVSGLKNANRLSGDLRIWGLQDEVKSIFELTRLNKVFQIFEDELAAVSSYQN
ncbi:STAS domain-containing protein [bacterium]|nr:STAS domain-containing protein [bacterium]